MSDDVTRQHIELYVNEFTDDVGESGMEAAPRAVRARSRRRRRETILRAAIRVTVR